MSLARAKERRRDARAKRGECIREVYSSIKKKEAREGKEEAREVRGEWVGRGGEVGCARARERERASGGGGRERRRRRWMRHKGHSGLWAQPLPEAHNYDNSPWS